ncbi:hypothetical protein D9M72_642670 [compost metagenome]
MMPASVAAKCAPASTCCGLRGAFVCAPAASGTAHAAAAASMKAMLLFFMCHLLRMAPKKTSFIGDSGVLMTAMPTH